MKRQAHRLLRKVRHEWLNIPLFDIRATDYFVTSWPRSGNTWMRYLLFNALFPEQDWELNSIEQRMPTLDRRGIRQRARQMEGMSYRLFKSHESFQDYYLRGRTVYIIRHGMDATVSLYNYRRQISNIDLSLSEFVRRTLRNEFRFGPWHRHVEKWLEHAAHEAVLIVRYEDMVRDTATELRRTLGFFGFDKDDSQIATAIERSRIEQVEKGFQNYAAQRDHRFDKSLGGGKGKGAALMSEQDKALFMQYSGKMMAQLGYSAW